MASLVDAGALLALAAEPGLLGSRTRADPEGAVLVSAATLDELWQGAEAAGGAAARARRLAFVEAVAAALPVLPVDEEIVRMHARLAAARRGMPRGGLHSRWVAASCLAHGLELVTEDPARYAGWTGLRLAAWPPKALRKS